MIISIATVLFQSALVAPMAKAQGLEASDGSSQVSRAQAFNARQSREEFTRQDADKDAKKTGWVQPGLRNLKAVLNGVLYRGGGPGGMIQLPNPTLQQLCEAGFSQAIYLYSSNFKGKQTLSCKTKEGRANTLTYTSADYSGKQGIILQAVHDVAVDPSKGPVFVHCWNGWHASGQIAAIALRQFCGWTPSEGTSYWDRNAAPGVNVQRIHNQISSFKPNPQLEIDPEIQKLICPR